MKGYQFLKETLKKQEDWVEKKPENSEKFKKEIENTRNRVLEIECLLD